MNQLIALLAALSMSGPSPASAAAPPVSADSNGLERFERDSGGVPIEGQIVRAELPPAPLRIAILPDRTTGRAWGLPYLAAAVEDLRRIGPDVVFTIGDMVQGYTRSTAQWDRETDEWFEIASGLPATAWPVAGNHDVVSGSRDPHDNTFEQRYRERFGPLRYAVEFDRATIVVAYSEGRRGEEGVAFSPEDLEWLDRTLARAANRGLPTVLLVHRPMWRSRSARWDELVHPMLSEYGVDAVVAGHFHALQRDADRDGVQYHVLGSCGGLIDQHPLSGQLHHLTFLSISPSSEHGSKVAVHHQLIGATLADDHVLEEDQGRAWNLKRRSDAAVLVDAIRESADGIAEPGPLRLELFNPLDVPVTWSWRGLDAPPKADRVDADRPGGLTWSSRTPIDTFNPHTMRTDSPLAIASGGPIELAPGERRTVELDWSLAETAEPIPPTELRLTAVFADSRDRLVPMTVIRRVPIARARRLVDGEAVALPISAWTFSPYDLPEPDAQAVLATIENDELLVTIAAPVDRLAGDAADVRMDRDRLDDPMQDAIRIELGLGASRRILLFEILPDADVPRAFEARLDAAGEIVGLAPLDGVSIARTFSDLDEGWAAQIRIPASTDAAPGGRHLQIGVADNDDTYHTQWRWLAPAGHPVLLERQDPTPSEVRTDR